MNCTKNLIISSLRSASKFIEYKNNRRLFSHLIISELRINSLLSSKQFNWSKCVAKTNITFINGIHATQDVQQSDLFMPSATKKRSLRKKRSVESLKNDKFNVFAFATADEYDLESLHDAIVKENLYETQEFFGDTDSDVLYVRGKYKIEEEPRDIFYFREGSVILWNCNDLETANILNHLKKFEISSYDLKDVMNEKEFMNYNYVNDGQRATFKNGDFFISTDKNCALDKYTFSNAMTSSVKLGIWELFLDKYIDSLEFVTTDLKDGRKIKLSRAMALKKTGELFALKHTINLSSNLLDTPDFYWDREQLEILFLKTCTYFAIQKRKRVNFLFSF